jgi:hypothetical protein
MMGDSERYVELGNLCNPARQARCGRIDFFGKTRPITNFSVDSPTLAVDTTERPNQVLGAFQGYSIKQTGATFQNGGAVNRTDYVVNLSRFRCAFAGCA